ncbi:MAG TPA: hypothetical protein VJ436_06880 [Anaerolineales bacterium]|nr:hypothetical protein [Anaerolineales bacterium]
MPTKMSRYLDGVIEAAWLAAVVLVPIFFNVYSNRIFEPDKIALLRNLALLILAAWLAKLVIERSARRPASAKPASRASMRVHLLALPVAGLALVYLISTALSVHPAISLWGSYQRLQGAYTFFSYLVIGLAIAAQLRRRAQVERLLTAMVLASLPVGLYGVLQRFGLDPVPWGGNVTTRIAANMGNSIFVAAYLIMAFPPTAVRCATAISDLLAGRGPAWPNLVRASAYVLIGGLQFTALLFSGSRGPLLGWLAGAFFLFVVLSLLWRQRGLTLSVIGVALAVGAFLVLFNLPNTPLQGLRAVPGIGRLGNLLGAESKTGRVRTLIWQGTAKLVLPHAPLEFPDGREDVLNFLRPLTGYGPESMLVAYNRFYPPELTQVEKRNAAPDRAHNETWDLLITTGLLGLVAYLALFGAIFYYGLKWLSLVPGRKERNLFLGLFLGLGGASALGFVLWQGPAYLGVGLPFGMIAGLILYLMLVALRRAYASPSTPAERWRALILIGSLATIVGHFVEINFGIAIAATRLYFWVNTGLLVAVGWRVTAMEANEPSANPQAERLLEQRDLTLQVKDGISLEDREKPASPGRRGERRARPAGGSRKKWRAQPGQVHSDSGEWGSALREAAPGTLLSALALFTLGYDFLSNATGGKSALSILGNSLFQAGLGGDSGAWVFFMFLATWLFAGILLAAGQTARRWGRELAAGLGLSAGLGFFYMFGHAYALASLGKISPASPAVILDLVRGYEGLFTFYFAGALALVLAMGYFLTPQLPSRSSGAARRVWTSTALATAFGLATLSLALLTNMRPIQADMAFKQADPYLKEGAGLLAGETALAIYTRAHELAPKVDFYLLHLGRANLELAQLEVDPAQRDSRLAAAREALDNAQRLNPLNPDHSANLARLYKAWADMMQDQATSQTYARAASEYYDQAVSLSPNNARLWDEWAALALSQLEQSEAALERLTHALKLDPLYDWTHALLGEYWTQAAGRLGNPQEQRQALERAAGYYQGALHLADPADVQTRYTYLVSQAAVFVRLEQLEAALAAYQHAVDLLPEGAQRWQLEEAIAQLYAQLGNRQQALVHAAYALSMAPPEQQPRLIAWIEVLKKTP